MNNKSRYYNALKENNDQLNEIDLGEKVGLEENETRQIIALLLSEHRIEYVENRTCHYKVMKRSKRND